MQQRTEIQEATRSVGFLFAGKKSVRCGLCNSLCESENDRNASGEYDALAMHLEGEHIDKHDEIISLYRGQDRR